MTFPFVVTEITIMFLVGVLMGVGDISARWVVLAAIAVFVIATIGDPLILPVFRYEGNLPFLLFWNGMSSVYMILGWVIYEAK